MIKRTRSLPLFSTCTTALCVWAVPAIAEPKTPAKIDQSTPATATTRPDAQSGADKKESKNEVEQRIERIERELSGLANQVTDQARQLTKDSADHTKKRVQELSAELDQAVRDLDEVSQSKTKEIRTRVGELLETLGKQIRAAEPDATDKPKKSPTPSP
jgi:Skp family chaperone for outer membrane proteins